MLQSPWISWLTRRRLLAVLLMVLTVALLFNRWAVLNLLQKFNSPRVVKVSTLLGDCKASSNCLANKPRTNAANSVPLRSSDEKSAGYSTRCSSEAVAKLSKNVYSDAEVPVRRLPQYLIIGVQKGGTRALLEFLNLHPDVRTKKYEMHFFNKNSQYKLGLDWYRRQMPATHAG